ncbi:oxidoreductase [Paenibacillus sp. J31TS4]|uniref:gluconate 2-dehydrogenase subunit 3 family protein n=1 Tax=Paenibacillus sp. J31TS4 TaxID=2807195 RepID=UPI001B0E5769|nr:gluconate 2-dehydrogenase subunit 3 family protein [Paenibacillus sp. J31TS4]GIP40068.1 oxidoreductase [Paenibacillus sp. J31TS4]
MAEEEKDQQPKQPNGPQDESRRKFLKVSGAALGGVVVGGVVGGLIGRNMNQPKQTQPGTPAKPGQQTKDFNQALMYMNAEQFTLTEALAERIFPEDELGPGAKALGVAFFIDHQLAGQWGTNGRDYMMGPFQKAEATQGYQAIFKRHELFSTGLQAVKNYAQQKYQKGVPDLTPEQLDELLTVFEKGQEVQINGLPSSVFFNLLRSSTLEGAYSDPLYGGNKDMQGWRMKKYPGNQMTYMDIIEKEEFVTYEPASLSDHMTQHG